MAKTAKNDEAKEVKVKSASELAAELAEAEGAQVASGAASGGGQQFGDRVRVNKCFVTFGSSEEDTGNKLAKKIEQIDGWQTTSISIFAYFKPGSNGVRGGRAWNIVATGRFWKDVPKAD